MDSKNFIYVNVREGSNTIRGMLLVKKDIFQFPMDFFYKVFPNLCEKKGLFKKTLRIKKESV